MPEVAQATITVTPVLEGAQQSLTEQMTGAVTPAGAAAGAAAGTVAGQSFGQTLGKGMSSAGSTLSKTVTAPIMGIGAAAVASWKSVDAGLDTIVQKTGASGDALDEMHGILENIATSIPTDFETAGAAIGEVNTRFGITGSELETLSGQFVKFAALNGQDVSNSVDSVSKMLASFGLEAGDAGKMLDALNVIGQQTGVDVGALSDTVAANAKQFQEMGLTAEEAAAFIGQASMAGLDSSAAMMGLKTAMKNATEEGMTLDEAIAGFEETMNSNVSETDKLAAAYELFGTRAGGAIENAVSNGTLNLSDFSSSLGDFEGSVSSTFEGTLDPMDEFQTTLNELKLLGADIVDAAGPALTDILGGIGDAVQKASEAWNGLSPEMQDTIIKVAGIAAVAGPLLLIGGKVIGGISSIAGGLGGLVGHISGLGGAASTAAGPVATAGASFGSMAGQALQLIAMAGALWITAEAISVLVDAAIRIADSGGAAIGVLVGMGVAIAGLMGLAAALGPALTAGAVGIVAFGASMLMIGGAVALACLGITLVVDAIGRLVETISSNAGSIISIVTGIGNTVSGVIDTISSGIVSIIDAISGGISGVLDSVAGIIDSIGEAALNAGTGFEKLADAVINLVNNTGVLDLGATLATVADGVKKISKAAGEAGTSATQVTALTNSFKQLQSTAKTSTTTFSAFGSSSKIALSGLSTAFRSLNLANSMKTAIDGAIRTASSGIESLKSLFARTSFSFNQYIALPHFGMSGSFNAKTGSVPSVSVNWYAKAAEYGALFDSPQIIGVGDAAQPEMLIGEQKLKEMLGGNGNINIALNYDASDDANDMVRDLAREIKRYRMAGVF